MGRGSRKVGKSTDLCSEARQMPAAWTEGLFDNHSKEEQIRAQQMSSQKNQKCFQQPSSISRSCGGWSSSDIPLAELGTGERLGRAPGRLWGQDSRSHQREQSSWSLHGLI